MITLESIAIAVLGAVLGLVVGLLIGVALRQSLSEDLTVLSLPLARWWSSWSSPSCSACSPRSSPPIRASRMKVLDAIATE